MLPKFTFFQSTFEVDGILTTQKKLAKFCMIPYLHVKLTSFSLFSTRILGDQSRDVRVHAATPESMR